MPRSAKMSKKPAAGKRSPFGALPEWNLADLYAGLDDPAIKRDLDRADAECVAFEEAYKGKLEGLARGPQGERRIPAQDLFRAALTTSLTPLEIITEVRFSPMPAQAAHAIEEFARRKGDFAIAAIAVMLTRDGERCTKARLATAGVGPASIRLRDAEDVLERQGLGEAAIEEAADKAMTQVDPISDLNGSAEYRRHLTGVLTSRAILKAIAPTN